MKRFVLFVACMLVALLVVACDSLLNSSQSPGNPPAGNPPANPSAAGQSTLPAPASTCQSRLWGKVTNTTNGQSPANVAVEVVTGGKTFKTVTDSNGLYGFAGLCAGDYALSLTPPGGKAIPNANAVKLDGSQPVKVDLTYK